MVGVAMMGQQYNGSSGADNLFGFQLQDLFGQAAGEDLNFDGSTVWGVTADISAKYENLTFFAAGIFQSYKLRGESDTGGAFAGKTYDPCGVVVQGGYSVNDNLELFTRYEFGSASVKDVQFKIGNQNTVPLFTEGGNVSILTVGANWFFNSKIKFTADWGINFADTLNQFKDEGDGWRSSATPDQWVLRAQLQLLF